MISNGSAVLFVHLLFFVNKYENGRKMKTFSFSLRNAVIYASHCSHHLPLMLTALDERMGVKLRELIHKGLVK